MDGLAPLFFIPFIIFAVGVLIWLHSRASDILTRWAQENGYEIVSSERCWLWRGPFWWRSSEHQAVFYVTVKTAGGQIRRGWVRCGDWFLGMFSDQATVQWDE